MLGENQEAKKQEPNKFQAPNFNVWLMADGVW